MSSNVDPFRCLFGGPDPHSDPNDTKKLDFDVLGTFAKRIRRISTEFASSSKRISRTCSAGIWFKLSIGLAVFWKLRAIIHLAVLISHMPRKIVGELLLFSFFRCYVVVA